MKVCVVIRARNAAQDLAECLPAVSKQRLPVGVTLSTLVVDNESSDLTRAVCAANAAQVVPISTSEFTWGRALNRGIAAGDADVAVLLSADATPVGVTWLTEMIRPFENPQIACVYGRQRPRLDAPIDEIARLERAFDAGAREISAAQIEKDLSSKRWVCSNACAAVRKDVWVSVPFDEVIAAAEELPWARTVIGMGQRVVYNPEACVLHSHREGVLRFAVREWEIHIRGHASPSRPRRLFEGVRLGVSLLKRRVRSCIAGVGHGHAVAVGLFRLPIECAAIGFVSASTLVPSLYEAIRRSAWRK